MDQNPQEIMHSLFSLDPSMENRGHLYPYNYPYGQYPYPYHYPYSAAHPSVAHSNIPPASHSIPPPSSHPINQASQSLSASQANLPAYSTGVHSIRPPMTNMREQPGDGRLHLLPEIDRPAHDTQQTAQDLRSMHSDSRSSVDSRHHPADMRSSSSEHRYLDEVRTLSAQPRNSSSDSRHLADYSPQPTDLRTQPIDARLFGDMRQVPDQRHINESRPLTDQRTQRSESSVTDDPRVHMGRSTDEYKYGGNLGSYSNHPLNTPQHIEEPPLSGDPRPPINDNRPVEESRSLYVPMRTCTNEERLTNHPESQKSSVSHDYYSSRPHVGHSNPSANGEDFTSTPTGQEGVQKPHIGSEYMPDIRQCTNEQKTQLNNPAITSEEVNERNMKYPTISSPNTSLGLLSHALGQHLGEEANKCGTKTDDCNSEDKNFYAVKDRDYNSERRNGQDDFM
nr:uncharacterized protein LOC113821208 [Penaeus vannamei]